MQISEADLQNSPIFQLWQASNAWQRLVRKVLEPLGLTHVQFIVLASINLLSVQEEIVTQAEVSRFAAIDENMTSQVIKAMKEKGMVEQGPHPTDSRAHQLALTAKGDEALNLARSEVKPLAKELVSRLAEQAEGLAGVLRDLVIHADAVRESLG